MVANYNDTRNNSAARVFTIETNNRNNDAPADFESAISATGFGRYNILLLLVTIPAGLASAFDMTTAAFIISSNECDLELTFIRKGILVSTVYLGMIVSSFFWGFVTESGNQRLIIVLGLLADACCNVLSSVVDSYHVFLLIKFITGTIVGGPFALLIPYVSEFQPSTHRSKVIAWTGFIYGFGNIIPAILAATILPLPWKFTLLDRVFDAWRIYILLCTLPSIIGLFAMILVPESPKSLMNSGNSIEALEIMRKMYAINTGNPPETFPIKSLINGTKYTREKRKTNCDKIRDTWNDFKLLLRPPHIRDFLIINFLQFGSMLGFNTMRLWVPHMFIILSNFDYSLWTSSRGRPTMCEMLVPGIVPPGLDDLSLYANVTDTCIRWNISSAVYINSTIIAASAVGFSFFIVMYLDTRIKKKVILIVGFLIGTLSGFGANWGQLVPISLCLCSAVIVTSRIMANIVITVNNSVIPVPLRVTSSSFIGAIGSLGTIVGNVIFSTILGVNCVAAFMWLGSTIMLCIVVSMFALRPPINLERNDKKAEITSSNEL